MANCGNCGKSVTAGVKFCPSCGTALTAAKGRSKGVAKKAGAADAESNKGMAVIAYIGILCLIPLLIGDYKKSPFLKFHTNQGVVLFISHIAWIIGSMILRAIFRAIHLYFMGSLLSLVSIAFLVLMILGIINAVNSKMEPLPVIGKFEIIK